MNKKDSNLLLKDLSARLPYGVKLRIETKKSKIIETLASINTDMYYDNTIRINNANWFIEDVKPYLFPLSFMTKSQRKEINDLLEDYCSSGRIDKDGDFNIEILFAEGPTSRNIVVQDMMLYMNWLNSNHFDYNNLIEKGLAIDATNLKIY